MRRHAAGAPAVPRVARRTRAASPVHGEPAAVLALQRAAGNRAVAQMLARTPLNGDPMISRRIEQARAHKPLIKFGEVHPAVRRIQERLAELGFEPALSRRKDGSFDGGFGRGTRDALMDYQANAGLDPDGIVGRETIGKLELPDGGLKPKPPTDKTKVDVIVRYQGVGRGREGAMEFPGDVFPDKLLETYRKKTGRQLFRIGHRTTTIRAESRALILGHAATIKAMFADKDKEPGKVFVYGSSSGGRNAIDLGVTLSVQGIPLAMVADMDAAWFADEAVNRPDRLTDPVTPVPLFQAEAPVRADEKRSYFQTLGNHAQPGSRGLEWKSAMDDEIHGREITFEAADRSRKVSASADDFAKHSQLIGTAMPEVRERIKAVLDSLPAASPGP